MNPVEWYYARDNKQNGPVSAAELKRLAIAGELTPDDLVWREGMVEWAAAKNVRGLFDDEGKPVAEVIPLTAGKPASPSADVPAAPAVEKKPAVHLFDRLIDWGRPKFTEQFFDTATRVFQRCGSIGLLAASALLVLLYAILTAKNASGAAAATALLPKTSVLLLTGLKTLVALIALQYVASKCGDALEKIHKGVVGSLTSTLVPDCVVVLSKTAGIVVLLGAIIVSIQIDQVFPLFPGVLLFAACIYLSLLAMRPAALGVTVAEPSLPGGELIGVVTFLLKALVRLTPVMFGLGVVCCTLGLAMLCVTAFTNPSVTWINVAYLEDGLLLSAGLPAAMYVIFLVVHLILNLWRSVLSLPQKLDKIGENTAEKPEEPVK